jgi:hypothetical protein
VSRRLTWRMGDEVEPKWDATDGYHIEVDGDPALTLDLGIVPGSASNVHDLQSAMDLGMTATGSPAVHAIPAVCAAAPGVLSYTDLPLHAARGVGAFAEQEEIV